MKNTFLLFGLLLAGMLFAQEPGNYKPDNRQVQLTSTKLPIVFITTGNKQIDREERIEAGMKIIYNGEGKLNYKDTVAHPGQHFDYRGSIGLKYRGNSSFTNSDKKPYAIRTQNEKGKKEDVSILGMGADNDWALLAPYSDRSMVRDMMMFTLARPYFDYVPHGKYCELILDGTYYGVYIMSERVRKGDHRLDIGKPGASGDELTGGYHLEIDRNDEPVYTSKHSPVKSDGTKIGYRYIHFQYKSPEIDELSDVQKQYIHGQIDRFENALAADNFTDTENGYRKYVDVTSFIDYMIATEFARNVDGYRLSTNLYKYRDSEDARFKTSLWDLNLGCGNADYCNGWYTEGWAYKYNDVNPGDDFLVPFWWQRLLNDQAFKKELKARWKQCREGMYSDASISHVLDSLTTLLTESGAVGRNSTAWPRWDRKVWPNYYYSQSYPDEINYLRNWIKKRVQFLDNEWLDRPLFESNAYYKLINADSRNLLSADQTGSLIPVADTENSDDISLWFITEKSQNNTGETANDSKEYLIRNYNNNQVASIGNYIEDNSPLMLESPMSDMSRQVWRFERIDNTFKIHNLSSNKVIRHRRNNGDNSIVQYKNNDSNGDKLWEVVMMGHVTGLKENRTSEISVWAQAGHICIAKLTSECQITVYTTTGKIIGRHTANSDAISIPVAGNNLYLVSVSSKEGQSVHKVLIP